jgi:hypothetical protein
VPLYLLATEAPSGAPTGPGISVPAVQQGGDARTYTFVPPQTEPGRLFFVSPKVDDPGCAPDPLAYPGYWVAGEAVVFPMILPGQTALEACALGDKAPCEYALVKGAFVRRGEAPSYAESSVAPEGAWVTEKGFYPEDLKKGKQRFRSSADLAPGPARLQASVLPFPKGSEGEPFSPPGVVASWDIPCINCEFTVDLSVLAPEEPPSTTPWYQTWFKKLVAIVTKPFELAWQGVGKVAGKIGDLVGLGGGGDGTSSAKAADPQLSPAKPLGDYLVGGQANPLLQPTTYYFRLLPLKGDTVAGAPSNPVRLQQVDKPPDLKITSPTPTAIPVYAYDVEIVEYHGIIPPQVTSNTCYIVTQDAWIKSYIPLLYTTNKGEALSSSGVKKGDAICKPKPKEPDIFQKIISWAEAAVNWASKAWADLKKFAVDLALKYTPLGLQCTALEGAGAIPAGGCAAAANIALNAALVSLGIPPDLPNFDQLMDQGIQYVAAQAAAQMAIPPEVVDAAVAQGGPLAGIALDEAESKLRAELQAQIEKNLKDVEKSIQLGYAASVSWVPDGIPVRPDDYQQPAMTARVTRKAGVPGGENGCTLRVYDTLKLDAATAASPPPGYEYLFTSIKQPLNSLTSYDLFANEAGLADKELFVPALAPGDSFTIPMTFRPNYYKSGWSPLGLTPIGQFIGVWRFLHDFGKIYLNVYGTCGTTTLTASAKDYIVATTNKGSTTGQ